MVMKKLLTKQSGVVHFFALLGMLAFFVIVWGVVAQWQKVATLSDQVGDLTHKLSKVEARLARLETH